ncbi:Sensory neuron membrane protein 2 [Bienertia sinuspersici]
MTRKGFCQPISPGKKRKTKQSGCQKKTKITQFNQDIAPGRELLETPLEITNVPKMEALLLELVHNARPTKDNLVKRRIKVNPTCAFREGTETSDHLFLNCDFAKRVWSSSVLGLRIPSHPTLSISTWFKNMFIYLRRTKDDKHQIWPNLVATAWAIWIHRNNIIFRNDKGSGKALRNKEQAHNLPPGWRRKQVENEEQITKRKIS